MDCPTTRFLSFVFHWEVEYREQKIVTFFSLWSVATLMSAYEVSMLVVNIDLFFSSSDFELLLQIFSRHAIMHLVEDEGEVLRYFNSLSLKVFEGIEWKWQKCLLLFFFKESQGLETQTSGAQA